VFEQIFVGSVSEFDGFSSDQILDPSGDVVDGGFSAIDEFSSSEEQDQGWVSFDLSHMLKIMG
jgi:hypothetical protein